MEHIDTLFPRYDQAGKDLIKKAYLIAQEALKDLKRSNGHPFIEHPDAVAHIADEEIGLPAECIAAAAVRSNRSNKRSTPATCSLR